METRQVLNILNSHVHELFTLCDLDNLVTSLGDFESAFKHGTAKVFIGGGSMSYQINDGFGNEWLKVEFEVIHWSNNDPEIVVKLKRVELI